MYSTLRGGGTGSGPISCSFEFFPPKTEAGDSALARALAELAPLRPAFCSVTYGAGGSTRARTGEIAASLRADHGFRPAAHLSCVGVPRAETDEVARDWWKRGIRHIVAIRGDPPGGPGADYVPHPGGYAHADSLVAALKSANDFEISVAAYPETHPAARSPDEDMAALRRKFEAGADRALTQFFFEAETFLRFRDRAAAAGISGDIFPGILPVGDFPRALRFSAACGISVPRRVAEAFDGLAPNGPESLELGARLATELCAELADEGVRHIHFYTLNHARPSLNAARSLATTGHVLTQGALS
jgi:methylenetetrahydrofolate reductase (NADPH)